MECGYIVKLAFKKNQSSATVYEFIVELILLTTNVCFMVEVNNLASAEAKCTLLERQLEYMRKMLQSAEVDRNEAIQRSTSLAQQAARQASEHVQSKLEKISGLERQHIELNAAQTVAEVS